MKRKIGRIQQKKLKNKLFLNTIKAKTSLVLALSACLSIPCIASDNLPVPNSINGATLNYLDKAGAGITAGSYADKANAAKKLNINVVNGVADLKYDTYNIGKNNLVNYNFTSSSQVALNRVTGTDPSKILGGINSYLNGQLGKGGTVYIINPNGILFGATSRVNVNALVASTLNTLQGADINSLAKELKLNNNPAGIYMEKGSNLAVQDNLIFVSSAIKDAGATIKAADANVHFVTADGVLFEFNNDQKITNVSANAPITVDADITVDGNAVGKTGTVDINSRYMKVNNLNIISKLNYTGVNNLVGVVNLNCIKNVGNDLTVDASGNITVDGPFSAGNNIDLKTQGDINTSSLTAKAGNAELTSTGGSITVDGNLYAKTASKNISLNAGDDITVNGSISAGNDITVKGDNIAVRYVKADKNINVKGTSFTSKQKTGSTSEIYHAVKAGENIGISTGSGKLELGYVNAGNNINLTGGSISTGILKAGDNIIAKGGSFTTKQERYNKSDLYHSIKADKKVDISTDNAIVSGNISAGGDINLNAGDISTRQLSAGNNIDITGTSINTKQVKTTGSNLYHAIKANGNITINQSDAIDIGYLSSDKGDISLTGTSISTRPITAKNDIIVRGTSFTTKKDGSSAYNSVKAGNNVDIYVDNGIINVGNIGAGNDIKLNGGSISTRELNAKRDVDVLATSFTTKQELSSTKTMHHATKANRDVKIRIKGQLNGDSGKIDIGNIFADDNIILDTQGDVSAYNLKASGNVDVSGKSINTRDVSTEGNVNFNATDDINLGHVYGELVSIGSKDIFDNYPVDNIRVKSIRAQSDINLFADKSITAGNLSSATGYINIERGAITTDDINAGKFVNLISNGDVKTGKITAIDNIQIEAFGDILTLGSLNSSAGAIILGSENGNVTLSGPATGAQGILIGAKLNINTSDLTSGTGYDILLIAGGDINTGDINSGKDAILAAIGSINTGNILAQNGILAEAASSGVRTGHLTAQTEDITIYSNTYIHTLNLNTPKNAVFAIPRFVDLAKNLSWGTGGKTPHLILLNDSIDSRQYADMLDNAIRTQPGLTRGLIDGQIQFTNRYFIPLAAAAELEEEDLFVDEYTEIDDNTNQ